MLEISNDAKNKSCKIQGFLFGGNKIKKTKVTYFGMCIVPNQVRVFESAKNVNKLCRMAAVTVILCQEKLFFL